MIYMSRSLIICLLSLITSGCVFTTEPYRLVKYHDLGNPDIIDTTGYSVKILPFDMSGPYKHKMIYRTDKNELSNSEYNRWVQSPEIMLTRYLKIAFGGTPADKRKEPEFTLSGTILSFEADMTEKKAVLTVEYEIIRSDSKKILQTACLSFSSDLSDTTPRTFADAMTKTSQKFAEKLNNELKTLTERVKN